MRFNCKTGTRVIFLGLTRRLRIGDADTGFRGDFRTGDVRRLFSVVLGDKIFGDGVGLGDTTEPIRCCVDVPLGEVFVESVPWFSFEDEPPEVTEALLRGLERAGVFCEEVDGDCGVASIIVRERRAGEPVDGVAGDIITI